MKKFVLFVVLLALIAVACAPTPEPTKAPVASSSSSVASSVAPTKAPEPTKAPASSSSVASSAPASSSSSVASSSAPALSSSASSKAPASSAASSAASGPVVKLSFWHSLSGNTGKALEAMVVKFNQTHPNIQVDYIYQGAYADIAAKLTAAVTAKTLPDVAQMGGAPTMADSGAIIPISDLVSQADLADIYPGFWDYNKYNGKVVSMPYNNSIPVLYYNKDMFTAAGLDPNKPPATWDDLLKAAQALTKTGQWGFNTHTDTNWYLSAMILQNGGKILSDDGKKVVYNSPEGIEALQFWGDLVTKYKVMPPNQHAQAQADFTSGKLAMLMRSSATLGTLTTDAKFNLGVAPLPCKKTCSEPLGGASLLVFKTTAEEQKAAWEFAQWMTNVDNNVELFKQTGYVPLRKSASDSPALKDYLKTAPNAQVIVDALKYSSAIPVFSELGNSDAELVKATQKVELGQGTAKDALDAAATLINKNLAGQ